MRWLRALKPMVVKEFRQIRRDPTALGMLLLLPAAIIVLVGYALNFDVKHISLAIFDQSKSSPSREFLRTFKQTEYFDHNYTVFSYTELEPLILEGQVGLAVIIPPSFDRDLAAGRDTHVQLLVDGADNNTAVQAINYAARIATNYSLKIASDAQQVAPGRGYIPIDFQPRVWYNPDLISSKFLVPGLIAFIMMLTGVISTSLTVVREKERGTMEQIMVSPLQPVQVIVGKTIPYLLISLVAATVILILGYILFDIEIKGSLILLYISILIFIVAALGQGLLISTVTDSQQVAFMLSVFSSLLPSFLLSGFVFPVESMPIVLRVLSNIAVTKFFLVIVRAIMLKGVGIAAVWDQLLYTTLFAAIMISVSSFRMRKRAK